MMFELAQHVMAYLHKHDRPIVSLHQEMVMRQEQEQEEKRKQQEDEQLQFRMREVEAVSGCGLLGGVCHTGDVFVPVELTQKGNNYWK
jgi:hypothetical protein